MPEPTDQQEQDADQPGDARPADGGRRPYTAPKILSAEPLEAAAATCQPQTGVFGKTVPIPCGTLGS